MAQAAVAQGLLTFAFTDIVGSTRLWERAPAAARQALARHNEMLQRDVHANGGTIFKTVGDACCCVFARPADAVRAAASIQRDLSSETWPQAVGTLQVRIGIHTGHAIEDRGDYFGPTLNRVARLTSAAHGGQILLSAAAAESIGQTLAPDCVLIDLGAHRLKDLAEPQRIYQLVVQGLPAAFPPPASLDARPNNLPSQLSTFVGRENETAELRDLLGTNRLVTVCGVGGIGKTRLALQVAADTIGRYKDGSWIVRLADIADPALIPGAIGATLHVSGVPGQSIEETLAEHLRSRELFLLLDNAEHVLAATAAIARHLLAACPQLAMLVTSREPLHLPGEHVLRVAPMAGEDAAKLFIDRAELSAADAHVRHICDGLDGLPLAIEIAAGRIGTLTTKQLDERLNSMLPVLVSKDATEEARHRTLQATIEWSYRLLNPKEQRFFALLSVFEGGFTLDACEAVAWAGEEDDPAYELLDALVDKSFVTAEPADDSMRYRLLEVLHGFAAAKLLESRDGETAHQLHFEYFTAMANRWGTWKSADEEREYVSALAAEIPNLRAALEWGFTRENADAAFELLLKVAVYWQQRCSIAEARAWIRRACDKAEQGGSALHAKLLRRAATFATIEDDYAAAREYTSRALSMFREMDDLAGTAEALHTLAVIEQRSGSEDEALRLYGEALQSFEQTGHEIGIITALYNLAQTSKHRADIHAAKAYLDRGMSLCTSAQHTDRLATFWTLRAELAMREGSMQDASEALQRALEMKRALGDRHDEVEVLWNIAVLGLRRGDCDAAERAARNALRLARELEVPSLMIGCFELFAVILMNGASPERAREVVAVAKAIREERGYVYGLLDELGPELALLSDVAPSQAGPEQLRRLIDELTTDPS